MTDPLLPQLQTYLTQVWPDRQQLAIPFLRSISNGWESDVYAFFAEWNRPPDRLMEELVLRIYPGEDAYTKSLHEFEALTLLRSLGYPVPKTCLLERDASPFGKPFLIMELVRGKSMWAPMFHGSASEQQRLLELFCHLFARLHALDWRAAVPTPQIYEPISGQSLVTLQLARWQPVLQSLPLPGFLPSWEWLQNHQHEVSPVPASMVHWDFHPENMLLKDSGDAVVIDWTGFEITDYRFDLAWTLLLIGANEDMRWREPVLHEYERQAGHPIVDLEFFDVASTLRRMFSVIASVSFGADKLGMRPGAEEIMRAQAPALHRVYELHLIRTGLTIPEVEQFLNAV